MCIIASGLLRLAVMCFKSSPTIVFTTDSSKAVVPILLLLCAAFWLILRGVLCSVLCCVLLLCFQSFNHCDPLAASMCAILAFVCFVRVGLCLCPLPHGARDLLRLVIVALPGLFFLPFQ